MERQIGEHDNAKERRLQEKQSNKDTEQSEKELKELEEAKAKELQTQAWHDGAKLAEAAAGEAEQ